MNKKTDNLSYLYAVIIRLACCFVLIMITFAALAGGSIFGGKKNKTNNPGGVYAIGVHFCSDLECPPIRIVEGNCIGEHMQKRYGVCICDQGYVASGKSCVACPVGQYSDGINGCTDCAPGTYKENESDTKCTPCPDVIAYCVNGVKFDCPDHAECTSTKFYCIDGWRQNSTGCFCPASGYYVDESGECKLCTTALNAKHCSDAKISQCVVGYYPADGGTRCEACSTLYAETCNSSTGEITKCLAGYAAVVSGEKIIRCDVCPTGYYCPEGEALACPEHAVCSDKSITECTDEHVPDKSPWASARACVCATGQYEDPDDEHKKCTDCPAPQTCDGYKDPDGGCCELTGPADVCGNPTRSLEFVGKKNAYGSYCYDCTDPKDIEGVAKEQCERCPSREYFMAGTKNICFAQKCESGFRDKDYGDCYACDYSTGVKADKAQCDKCSNRVWVDGQCMLKCAEGYLMDRNHYVCYSCSTDREILPLTDDDCTDSCPGLRQMNGAYCVRSCSGHGTVVNHKCVCEAPWHGEECDSNCGDAKGKDKVCHKCDEIGRFKSTKAECDRCEDRVWDSDYCYLKICVPDTFRAITSGSDTACYACDDTSSVEVDDVTQCNKCMSFTDPDYLIKRELKVRGGKNYCEMTADYCHGYFDKKDPGTPKDDDETDDPVGPIDPVVDIKIGGFKDYYGNCHSCATESAVGSEKAECAVCEGRLYDLLTSKCYMACDSESFRDSDLNCHKCSDTESYEATTAECNRCENRRMAGGYCIPATCRAGEIYDLTTHKCVSCYEDNVRPTSDAECTSLCPNIRELVSGSCLLVCSGHGSKVDGATTCTCDNGWYGRRCDSTCNGFWDKLLSPTCHGCKSTLTVESVDEEECNRCPERFYEDDKCYPPCDGFRDSLGECHECSDTGAYIISYEECFRGCTKSSREMIYGYCVPKCV